jgi:hypothetical protein
VAVCEKGIVVWVLVEIRRYPCGTKDPSSWKYQVPGTRYQVPGTRYQVPGTRYQVPGTRYQVPGRLGYSRLLIRVGLNLGFRLAADVFSVFWVFFPES